MLAAAIILEGVIIGTLIHIIFPLVLWTAYRVLVKRIKKEQIKHAPINHLAFIFATYGGLLYVILTILYWPVSGIFYIVAFYLIIGGPMVMGYISYKNWKRKSDSIYHMCTYRLAVLYMIVPMTLLYMA